jgi:hypothetical protein
MPKRIEYQPGDKRGRLTYVKDVDAHRTPSGQTMRRAQFTCDCGNETIAQVNRWRSGMTMSCGCFHAERLIDSTTTHGHAKRGQHHPKYESWQGAKRRSSPSYWERHPTYAGVTLDPRWATFPGFLEHQPAGVWSSGMHLARTGDVGPYSPENTRWATPSENSIEARSH